MPYDPFEDKIQPESGLLISDIVAYINDGIEKIPEADLPKKYNRKYQSRSRKGMCKICKLRSEIVGSPGAFWCERYDDFIARVAWNCPAPETDQVHNFNK